MFSFFQDKAGENLSRKILETRVEKLERDLTNLARRLNLFIDAYQASKTSDYGLKKDGTPRAKPGRKMK
jgi:exonuclease VII small subunit